MTPIPTPSPNFDPRPAGAAVDMLVLHYTGMPTAGDALARLCDPAARVSCHYLVDEDGAVHALVDEAARAWHAGESFWRGFRDVNARSVGIELVNPGHEHGYRAFPEAQVRALAELAAGILARHAIPARNVVGHSDVAPRRKQDPGELFPWARLARQGIGLWPEEGGPVGITAPRDRGAGEGERGRESDGEGKNEIGIGRDLALYGYDTGDLLAAVSAFQRHFRPLRVDGRADRETRARLAALLGLVPAEPAD